MKSERIYKEKNLTYKLINLDKQQGIVEIAVNAFNNVDYDGDISHPKSFNRTIKNNFANIKHLAYHDHHLPIGLPIEFKVTDEHLIAVSQLNLEKNIAKDVFADYLFYNDLGRTLQHSIGAKIVHNEFDNEKNANLVTEWELLEYSTVLWGANPNTPTLSVKNLESMLSYDYTPEKLRIIEKFLSLLEKYQKNEDPENILNSFENTLKFSTLKKEDIESRLTNMFNKFTIRK